MVDIATRVWNHKWKIDPIVRSLIDTDFYKLLMCQSVFRNKPDTQVTFSLINRTKTIRLAELIDEGELREQLDHVRSLSLSRGESTWMRGNTFYGKRQMFTSEFMDWFENLRLPPYHQLLQVLLLPQAWHSFPKTWRIGKTRVASCTS